jgi:hypothetical protein
VKNGLEIESRRETQEDDQKKEYRSADKEELAAPRLGARGGARTDVSLGEACSWLCHRCTPLAPNAGLHLQSRGRNAWNVLERRAALSGASQC